MSEAPTPAPAADVTPAADAPAPDAVTSPAPAEGPDVGAPEPSEPAPAPASGDSEAQPTEDSPGPPPDITDVNASPEGDIDPSKYDFKLPEGFERDEALETSARDIFAKNNVPVEAAQPLVDLFAATLSAAQKAQTDAIAATQSAWLTETQALPEFQEGPTRAKTLEAIGKLVDVYGSPEFREQYLANPMFGNNPHAAKFLANVAAALNEGSPAPAGRPANIGKSNGKEGSKGAHLAYPNTPEIGT